MQRPLLAVCMCFVAVIAMGLVAGGTSRGGSSDLSKVTMESSGVSGGILEKLEDEIVTVTGNVYRKDSKYFYLDSVFIQNHAANLQQTIPLADNLICEYEKTAPKIGSSVTVKGRFIAFQAATNPGEFDGAEYYGTLGIVGRIADISEMKCSEDYSLWQETLFELRCYFKQRLYGIFPEKEASIMTAMLLGDKQGLDKEIKELYQDNGIIHILSISGLHITIIGMSIYRLLRRVGVPVWAAALAGGGILLLYGVMTGMSVSTCRAIGMYLIKMLAELTGRTYDMLIAMGIMAAGMIARNPLYLKNAGFLLSYGAIAGIGMVYPALCKEDDTVIRVQKYEGRSWRSKVKELEGEFRERLKQSMLAGLSVTLTTLPIQLWFYYEVPVYSVIINLFVLPFMTLIMLTGLVAMLVPGLGILGTVDCLVLSGYEWLCRCFEKLPFATWNPGKPQVWQMVVYYGVVVLVVMREKYIAGSVTGNTLENVKHKLRIFILTISVGIFALNIRPQTTITFLDVGQGDCICVQLSSGQVYLFDCGSTSRSGVGEYVLKPYLKYCGISHIDGVFVSHADKDHLSGVEELLENGGDWGITVGQLVVSGDAGVKWAEQLIKTEVVTIYAAETWEVEGNRFVCLHPTSDLISEDSNAGSQCFYIELAQGLTLLLTGDVEAEGEEMLLEELQRRGIAAVDVLKVAHHGSKNSSCEEVLEQLMPQISVISCGRNNSYGHPHAEALERLNAVGSDIMTTADCGAITVEIGQEVKVYGFTGQK